MRFNRIAVADKYAKIAEAMGKDIRGLSVREEASLKAIEAVKELLEDLDMPRRLKDIGVKEEDLPEIAKRTIQTVEIPGNPRTMTEKDLLNILEAVY